MCNPAKAFDRAFDTNVSGYNPPPPPPPPPPPTPAPAPTPAPVAAPAPPPIDYAGLAKGYTDYARPQIDTQYQHANDALATGLAERGLAGSNIAKTYGDTLTGAYNKQIGGLSDAANTYAHGDTSKGYTPLGDLFSSMIQPVATFNANNRFTAPPGMAPMQGANAVGSGASSGSSVVNLASGNSSRVVR
jgi:hypothetical protein